MTTVELAFQRCSCMEQVGAAACGTPSSNGCRRVCSMPTASTCVAMAPAGHPTTWNSRTTAWSPTSLRYAALGIRAGAAVAHSMGGGTALLTEATRPGTFARLWVYEPIIFPRTKDNNPSELVQGTLRRRPGFPSRADATERYGSRPPFDELHPEVLAAHVQHGFMDGPERSALLRCTPQLEARAYDQYLRDGFQRLGQIEAPVTVAYGTATAEPSGIWAPAEAEALPNGRPEMYEDARHLGCFDDINRTVASLVACFSDR